MDDQTKRELDGAVKSRRQYLAWKNDDVSRDEDYPYEGIAALHIDQMILADAYLDEHRPDDGEPLDEEWLRRSLQEHCCLFSSHEFSVNDKVSILGYLYDPESSRWEAVNWQVEADEDGCSYRRQANHICDLNTRGDVRDLCRLLKREAPK